MADSKSTQQLTDLIDRCYQSLHTHTKPGEHLTVALSGGVDSVVLLKLLSSFVVTEKRILSAVHVEHGISPHTREWSNFCATLCKKLAISLTISRLKIRKQPQESLEAAARHARYRVFENTPSDYIVLAHHQDDQVETLMLQLLRGAGVKGLSAMPEIRPLKPGHPTQLLRPLLTIPRSAIIHYAQSNNLSWVTDESNVDTSYARNFLRYEVFPLIEQRYPAYRKTLSRSCRHLGEAAHLLDVQAQADAERVMVAVGKINLHQFRSLTLPRARNLLRFLLTQQKIRLPSSKKLEEILRQLHDIQSDNHFQFTMDTLTIRCYQNIVEFLSNYSATRPKKPATTWNGESSLTIEFPKGLLKFNKRQGIGVDLNKLNQHAVTIRLRSGGERFQPNCKRPRRSLKKILQEAAIPPWKRDTLPLLYCGEHLVWVAKIGVDCHFQTQADKAGVEITWHPTSEKIPAKSD